MKDVYEECPKFENEKYIIRPVLDNDAVDLLKVYSDEKAVLLFNSDNCGGDDFHYTTLERMKQAIDFWKSEREAYYNVLDTCHVKADEACMIGDNYLWEVEAPKKYGLNAILINRTNSIPDDCNADYTIKSISELLKIFE